MKLGQRHGSGGAVTWLLPLALFAVAPTALTVPTAAQLTGMGAIGDSLTDEYAEGNYSYALNWLQQIVIARDVNFGPTATEAGQPGGTWGEPRRTQYEHNWARSGADSGSLLAQGQHIGLAGMIESHVISHAVLAIGSNDFAPIPLPGYAYYSIYWDLWSQAQIQAYISNVADNITAATDTVLAEDVSFVLANVPDYGVTPLARQFFPNAVRREKVTVVINELNGMIDALAQKREIALIDVAGLATAIFGTNFDLHEILVLGNVEIYLWESDTAGNANPQAGFVHDGIHPHTTLQGLFANLNLEALNIAYGENIELLSEAEILALAGLEWGGADTLPGQIGAFADYVYDYTATQCAAPDLNCDGVVDGADLAILLSAWGPCGDCDAPDDCPADLNGDCEVDGADLAILLSNWG